MAKVDLTDAYIRKLSVEKRTDIIDARTLGLALRITPAGQKSFAVRVRGRDGKAQRMTLGQYPEVTLREARELAIEARRAIHEADGNLNAGRKAARASNDIVPSLATLLIEYQAVAAPSRRIWRKSPRGNLPEAHRRILAVFGGLAERQSPDITAEEFAQAMKSYVPKSGKESANGQVSRARAYLMTVLDWGAKRGRFDKAGKGRDQPLELTDLRKTHDPAADDETISGERDRVLDQDELARVLPLLRYPAPACLKMVLPPEQDFRPLALRFLLLTLARLDEMVGMRWRDFDRRSGVWNKPYVKTHSGPARRQTLPLSDAAVELLKGLPGYDSASPNDLVFPSGVGSEIENWDRITRAVMRESQTSGWHRHDLRRTSATLLEVLEVPDRIIDKILAHKAGTKSEGTSHALKNYVRSKKILNSIGDPQKDALDKLAETLAMIEAEADIG